MKKTLIFSLVLCAVYSQSQSLFNKIYPKPDWDFSTAVIETNENSYLIASSSRSQFNSDYDILLMNIDTIGNIIWEKYLGQSNKKEFASNICRTSDGGYIIGGSYRYNSDYDTYILKIDSNGDESWSQRVNPTSLFEDGYSAFENASGEYIILGSENHTHIYNLSNSGNLNWSALLQNFSGKHIEQTSDGGYALIGSTTNPLYNQIVLIKTNTDGDSIWSKQYGGEGDDFAYAFTLTPDDGFLIAAAFDSPIIDDDYWTFLIRTDSSGDTLWTKQYSTGTPYYIQNTADGGYIYSSIEYVYMPLNDMYRMVITKINSNGEIEWNNTFDNKNLYEPGNNLFELNDGGYLLTGHTEEGENADVFLIKLDAEGNFITRINTLKSNDLNFALNPNPAKQKVKITLTGVTTLDKVEVQIYDEFGNMIKRFQSIKSNYLKFDISELTPGIYFARLLGGNYEIESVVKKLIIIE
ncbi:MAG: T9SS type A sorting domain-containing protein [Bacteroidales bacterium]